MAWGSLLARKHFILLLDLYFDSLVGNFVGFLENNLLKWKKSHEGSFNGWNQVFWPTRIHVTRHCHTSCSSKWQHSFQSFTLKTVLSLATMLVSCHITQWQYSFYLTHWGQDNMAPISQITLSSKFSWLKNIWILIRISLKLVPKGPINNISALIQIMARRRPGNKPSSEPMMP